MEPRHLVTKEDYLQYGQKVLKAFKSNHYKSSYDYYRSHYPYLACTLASVKDWISNKNIIALQGVAICELERLIHTQMIDIWHQTHKVMIQHIALNAAILQIAKHGECGMQAYGLILFLMKSGFPNVSFLSIEKNLHGFVVISDPTYRIQVILDPFFNICCFYDDYQDKSPILQFGRGRNNNPSWQLPLQLEATYYQKNQYGQHLSSMEDQIVKLTQLAEHSSIKELLNYLNYMSQLTISNFDSDKVVKCMWLCLKNGLQHIGMNTDKYADALKIMLLEKPKFSMNNNSNTLFQATAHNVDDLVHKDLVAKIKVLVAQKNKGQAILDCIVSREYGSALRTACNHKEGFDFVECMLAVKNDIKLQLDEKKGAANMSALDYADKHKDKKIYHLLIQHGAIPHGAQKNRAQPG